MISCGGQILFGDAEKEVALAALRDEQDLARLEVFAGEKSTRFLLSELEACRQNGNVVGIGRIAEQVRARLFDLSAFMKELKLRMTLAYNFASGRTGIGIYLLGTRDYASHPHRNLI